MEEKTRCSHFMTLRLGVRKRYTYDRALDLRWQHLLEVCKIWSVEDGRRVVIYMPMVPEAIIAMLACARLGAIHSAVFGVVRGQGS
jgi:acyl-coenzyme A synthetase/AMP-(fatty) acid ligase